MQLEKDFSVRASSEDVRRICEDESTLLGLFPDTRSEVVAREPGQCTVRSHYTALGQEGTATFHFYFYDDGIEFEKVCDGRVWKALEGRLSFDERGSEAHVRLSLDGKTKSLVPEFTIKGPMTDQIEEMARALRERLTGDA